MDYYWKLNCSKWAGAHRALPIGLLAFLAEAHVKGLPFHITRDLFAEATKCTLEGRSVHIHVIILPAPPA